MNSADAVTTAHAAIHRITATLAGSTQPADLAVRSTLQIHTPCNCHPSHPSHPDCAACSGDHGADPTTWPCDTVNAVVAAFGQPLPGPERAADIAITNALTRQVLTGNQPDWDQIRADAIGRNPASNDITAGAAPDAAQRIAALPDYTATASFTLTADPPDQP